MNNELTSDQEKNIRKLKEVMSKSKCTIKPFYPEHYFEIGDKVSIYDGDKLIATGVAVSPIEADMTVVENRTVNESERV